MCGKVGVGKFRLLPLPQLWSQLLCSDLAATVADELLSGIQNISAITRLQSRVSVLSSRPDLMGPSIKDSSGGRLPLLEGMVTGLCLSLGNPALRVPSQFGSPPIRVWELTNGCKGLMRSGFFSPLACCLCLFITDLFTWLH